MINIIIDENSSLKEALVKLDENPKMQTLFVTKDDKIIGTITDGDIRRGLINGLNNSNIIADYMNRSFTFLKKGEHDEKKLNIIKNKKLEIVPVLNQDGTLDRIIDFTKVKTILPIDAIIMAGGVGSRLMPLTKTTPKPMLEIGNKPIIDYNVELLKSFGISNLTLSVKYLKEQIEDYFKDGQSVQMNISYITEDTPLGTIGAIKQINTFHNDYILVMNSDLLTNIDLEAMFMELTNENSDMIVATTDYQVQVPYGIIESNGNKITSLKEKPTYTYYSNAGIYIFKKELIELIPNNSYFNATDFIEKLLNSSKTVLHYPIKKYWLDIGKHIDFEKAKRDVNSVIF